MSAKRIERGLRFGLLLTGLVAVLAASTAHAEELKVWRHGIVEAKSDFVPFRLQNYSIITALLQ